MAEIDSKKNNSTIYIDIGNSTISFMYEESGNWQLLFKIKLSEFELAVEWLQKHRGEFTHFVVASVRADLREKLKSNVPGINFGILTIGDIDSKRIDYRTPQTLGIDRVLGCLAAYSKIKDRNVLVIDSGSACTIDFMDKNGVYEGGIIIPGLKSFFGIFKEKAPELPDVTLELPEVWPGKDTRTSLQWGQLGFYLDGIRYAIQKFLNMGENTDIYITGGDAEWIYPYLDMTEIKHVPFLVAEGMKLLFNGRDKN